MTCYRVTIQTDNAAFENDPSGEVSRILETQVIPALKEREIAECIVLRDINGNKVGYASIAD